MAAKPKRRGYADGGVVGQTESQRDQALQNYGQTLASRRQSGTDVDQKADAYRQSEKYRVVPDSPAKKSLRDRLPQGTTSVDRNMNTQADVPDTLLGGRSEMRDLSLDRINRGSKYNADDIAMARGGKVKNVIPMKKGARRGR